MEDKLDKILDDLTEIKLVQAENTLVLKEHARRSGASESRISIVEALAEKTYALLNKHLAFLQGAIWLLSGLAAIIGVIFAGIAVYFKYFKGVM